MYFNLINSDCNRSDQINCLHRRQIKWSDMFTWICLICWKCNRRNCFFPNYYSFSFTENLVPSLICFNVFLSSPSVCPGKNIIVCCSMDSLTSCRLFKLRLFFFFCTEWNKHQSVYQMWLVSFIDMSSVSSSCWWRKWFQFSDQVLNIFSLCWVMCPPPSYYLWQLLLTSVLLVVCHDIQQFKCQVT